MLCKFEAAAFNFRIGVITTGLSYVLLQYKNTDQYNWTHGGHEWEMVIV